MSSARRASSASSASSVSSRLRSRISGCDFAPFAHTLGSEIFSSITASSRFSRAASKILPQLANPFAHRGVSVFQIVNHASSLRPAIELVILSAAKNPRIWPLSLPVLPLTSPHTSRSYPKPNPHPLQDSSDPSPPAAAYSPAPSIACESSRPHRLHRQSPP